MTNQKHDNHKHDNHKHDNHAGLVEACNEALVLLRHLGKNRDDFLAVELLEDALAKINQE